MLDGALGMLDGAHVDDTPESSVQATPESSDLQMFPFRTTAASLVPSLEEVIETQDCVALAQVFSVQVSPESTDLQMFPPPTTAASLVPSLEEVIERQIL